VFKEREDLYNANRCFNCNKSNLTAIAICIIKCVIGYDIEKKNSPK
jgi:hypothetical protein